MALVPVTAAAELAEGLGPLVTPVLAEGGLDAYRTARSGVKYVIKKGRKFSSRQVRLKPKRLFKSKRKMDVEDHRFGEDPNQGTAKRVSTTTNITCNDRQLNTMVISMPTSGVNLDQRIRDQIYIKGLKVCFNGLCTFNDSGQYKFYYVNVALLSRKDNTTSISNLETDFFRGHDNQRAADFNDVTNALDRHCRPINTDKYAVWMHKRFKIGRLNADLRDCMHSFSKWVPVNRQVRFDGTNKPQNEFLLCWYLTETNTVSGTVGTSTIADCEVAVTKYYDEPLPSGVLKAIKKYTKRGTRRKTRKYRRS